MANPNDVQQDEAATPMSADDRFAALVNQSRGLRSEVTGESVLGESLIDQAVKLKSIRRRFLTNVLPIMIIPILLLGFLAVLGLGVLGQRTNDAVDTTDDILIEHNANLAETMGSASDTGAGAIDEFLFRWFERVDGIEDASEDATLVARRLQTAINILPQTNVQVVFTTANGDLLSHSTPDTALDSYADAEWLTLARENDQFRSFVDDGEHVQSFEFARSLSDGNILRVRVPFVNIQNQLDRVTNGEDFDLVLIDSGAGVLLGDTATNHNPATLFIPVTDELLDGAMEDTSANFEAMDDGFFDSTEGVTSTSSVLQNANPQSFPFIGVDWDIQSTQALDSISTSLLSFRDVAEDVNEQQRVLSMGIGIIVVISVVLAFFALRFAARQISKPVEQLSLQAQTAADVGIPAVVEAARTSDELPELDEFKVDSDDEMAILAASLNTMQNAAVDLAAGQAQLRRQNVSRTFVSLGRRNQNLLNRQLEFIEELEQQERDADALENLFRLDHLATRMRRNAENLLVLAGEQTPRRWGKPIAVRDVLRAAASEIADYRRVRLGDIDPATVSGNLATDLSHLFAELLENAGSFSPPTTPIEVFGQQTDTHYRLAIVDQGIGMDDESLAQVNERLENPVDFADAPSAYLGLFVVGRLSQEMGVTVRLASADPTGEGHRRGTIAFIDLPNALLSQDVASTLQTDEKASEAVARRTDQVDATQAETSTGAAVFAEDAPGQPAPASDAPTAPAEAPVPVAESAPETTSAGFPKRSKGTSEAAPTPAAEAPAPAPAAQAAPTPAAEAAPATTTAGFPKRSKGATEVKTTPDKFVSDTPAVAEAAPAAQAAPAPAAEAPAPAAEAAPATTTAGFPKRSKGATEVKTTPDKFVSSTPAIAGQVPAEANAKPQLKRDPNTSAVALVNAAKAEAKAKAAAETAAGGAAAAGIAAAAPAPAPEPTVAPAPEAAPAPTGPTTSAGFPKRGGSTTSSSIPQPTVDRQMEPAPTRDADHVKNSLMAYRAAVARGRSQGEEAEMPAAVAATVGSATPTGEMQDQDNNARPGSAS